MKIAVNTRLLLNGKLEGIGRFTHEILKRLVLQMPETEFTFLFDRPFDESFIYAENVTGVVLSPQARHPFLYHLWFEQSMPRYLKKHPHDVLLSTDGYLSLKANIKKVNVMHDINFEHFPDLLSGIHLWHYKKYFPRYARFSDRLLTVSEFSRFDIAKTYEIEESNIDVIYNGVADTFAPVADEVKRAAKEKWTDGSDFFVYVGSMNLRKNLPFLLRAFDRFISETGKEMKLVLIGSKQRWLEESERVLRSLTHASKVIFTGRLSDDEMSKVIASALAMTYVPLFEGFGIPVIESFACGVPVITSNVSSLPEVAEEAALYVDPYEEGELVGAMKEICEEEAMRQRLIDAGLKRSAIFSWDKSATKLSKVINQLVDE